MQAKQTIFFSFKMWLQDRKFENESIRSPAYNSKRGSPVHKIQITNNTTDEKELVECQPLLFPYN